MEQRNLDFSIELTDAQWVELGRRADALGPADGGFDWDEREFGDIHVFLRLENAPDLWRDYVTEEGIYGLHEREVAQFRFNDGRPFAHIELPNLADEPVLTEQEEEAMRIELESWVRDRWDMLLRDAGIHYERGHLPQS